MIDNIFFREAVKAENDKILNSFNSERDYPIRVLGDTLATVIEEEETPEPNKTKVIHYALMSLAGPVWRLEDYGLTLHTLCLLSEGNFHPLASKYLKSAAFDLKILDRYLKGDYDLNSDNLSKYARDLFKLFEKAIPVWDH